MNVRSRIVLLGASIITAGCVVPFDMPSLTRRAESVTVYSLAEAVPTDCTDLGAVDVVDGNWEYSKGYIYDGTRDRALIRLRNEVASKQGNSVVIGEEGELVELDGPGHWYHINGRVLKCSGAVRPDSALCPPHSAVTASAYSRTRRAAGRARHRER